MMSEQLKDSEEVKEASADEEDLLTAADLDDPDSQDLAEGAIIEDPENVPKEEGKDTPTDASTGEEPADSDEAEIPPDSEDGEADVADSDKSDAAESTEENTDEKKPKDVPGESAKEKALRLETQRLRQKLRQERGKKMFSDAPVAASAGELSDEDKKVLEGFDPEQVANMEKLFAIQAKKMGFVKKDEFSKQTYQDQAQATLDDFLEKHSQYDEKNDPEGILWKRFGQEYAQYKAPQNPRDLTKIFNRIHRELFGIETDTKDLKDIAAKQEKVKTASHGSSSASATKPKTSSSKVDPELAALVKSGALKGYSPEELKEEFGIE